MSAILPPKKDVALALLERASVFVHLDPRAEGVVVPPWLKKQPQLVLQIGLNMAVKIPDLEIAENAVSCTLSFSRRPHFCYVPWTAVYALVGEDGRGMVWPEDIPPEVSSQTPAAATARRRPTLRPVANPDADTETESDFSTPGGAELGDPLRPAPELRSAESRADASEARPNAAQRRSVPPQAQPARQSQHPRESQPPRPSQLPRESQPPRQSQPVPSPASEHTTAGRRSPSERPYLRLVK
jgi:stringent starvation protein B